MAETQSPPSVRTFYVTAEDAQSPGAEALAAFGPIELEAVAPGEATARMARSPGLALVAIDGRLGESTGAPLVSEFQKRDPALPIVWLGSTISLSKFGPTPPNRVLPSPTTTDCEQAVRDLLRFDVYKPPVVRALVDSTLGTLSSAFHTEAGGARAFFKANQLVFAPTSAILPFSGARLSGWCLVSGDDVALTAIRAATLPNAPPPGQADLEDVAGEMANHIVAHVKRWFARQDIKLSNGTPILLQGTEYKLREKGGLPGVVVAPEVPGQLYVQLTLDAGCCIDLKDPDALVELGSSAFEMLT